MKAFVSGLLKGRRTRWSILAAVLACWLDCSLPSALAALGSFTQKEDMPTNIIGAASCAVDGILYVAAGHFEFYSSSEPYRTLFAYDPKTDSWSSKEPMRTGRDAPAAAAVDGIIYVIGGAYVGQLIIYATVEAFDPKTDTWTNKTSMPTARMGMAACTLDGLIYVIGGYRSGGPSSVVECYDPKTDRWTSRAPLPAAPEGPVAQVVNGLIYVFSANGTFAYDPETNRWTRKASTPAGSLTCVYSAAGTVGGVVFLFGGISRPADCASAFTLAYDPVLDRFAAKTNLPGPLAVAAYAAIDGKIYLAGGASGITGRNCPGAVTYDSVWAFDPQLPRVDLIKAVRPSFSNLFPGTSYQMKISSDLTNWTDYGSPFPATSSSMVYPEYFDVDNWAELFFQVFETN